MQYFFRGQTNSQSRLFAQIVDAYSGGFPFAPFIYHHYLLAFGLEECSCTSRGSCFRGVCPGDYIFKYPSFLFSNRACYLLLYISMKVNTIDCDNELEFLRLYILKVLNVFWAMKLLLQKYR